ncbi:hypothetical protein BHE97_14125 [Aeromicrobium sp. PE09-221]|uniref:oxygenase MpaB family protein n=1 Tax=Aeromicrobium sp. PE09-221 TaxID=1898043 RepID=UPI000B3E4B5F|nr:oxygenase MpaB family protein [Aeromicrobium sp. PE09-221]OUZ08350.1 hypothetical protein BHE97_14125 [Aeromicrobium sp. PE09-221]
MIPTRFRERQERGARIGRPLKYLGRVGEVDEELLDRLGRGLTERDEPGAALADAIRSREVSLPQLEAVLTGGIAAVTDAPEPLRTFFTEVTTVPDWVDWKLIDDGGRVMNRLRQNAADVLMQLSLIGGYRFGGPTDLLVATGGLSGDGTLRRLAETQKWTISLSAPGGLRPGGEAWRLTVHVRVMHALVNASFEPRWDNERWGLPINQTDQAGTLGLFDGALIIGCRALGVRINGADARALMHLWRWVGHLMGVPADLLTDDEWERHRINYHVLLAQAGISEAGPKLAQAIVAAQDDRGYPGWPRSLRRVRASYERERLLSMLTTFLGVRSMRELGLPIRPPWAFAYLIPLNTMRYHVLGRTRVGSRLLGAWGDRTSRRILDAYFGGEEESLAEL